MEKKTNAVRKLDQKKIKYMYHSFEIKEVPTGAEVAKIIDRNVNQVFKTLVTQGKSKEYYVFVIPVCMELNLKKAAKATNEKSIAMIKSKELLPITGYIHGGCSPIGMKKAFKTCFHISIKEEDIIIFSAGKIGRQIEMKVVDLHKVIKYDVFDVADKKE